jgi:hypothetical protein
MEKSSLGERLPGVSSRVLEYLPGQTVLSQANRPQGCNNERQGLVPNASKFGPLRMRVLMSGPNHIFLVFDGSCSSQEQKLRLPQSI